MSKNVFKGLNLDREKIHGWICEFCEEEFVAYDVSEIELISENNQQYRFTITGDNEELVLDLYYNNNGSTTLQPNVGKNKDISLKLAIYISQKIDYKKTDIKNSSYSVHPIEVDNVGLLKEYLEELEGVVLIQNSYNSINKYRIYQFQSNIGDKITLKYYDNKRLQVQGKPMYLYQEVTCFLAEFFPFDDIVDKQSEFFSIDIQPKEILEEMEHELPKAFSILDPQLKSILSASLAYRKIDINLPDYSSFVFPVLRVLEGYLKYLFSAKGIFISNVDGFNMFYKKDGSYLLDQAIKAQIGCTNTCKAIEKCYNFYKSQRHGLFHTELVASATRIIEKKQEADSIIAKTLFLIENTYNSIAA